MAQYAYFAVHIKAEVFHMISSPSWQLSTHLSKQLSVKCLRQCLLSHFGMLYCMYGMSIKYRQCCAYRHTCQVQSDKNGSRYYNFIMTSVVFPWIFKMTHICINCNVVVPESADPTRKTLRQLEYNKWFITP